MKWSVRQIRAVAGKGRLNLIPDILVDDRRVGIGIDDLAMADSASINGVGQQIEVVPENRTGV